jgi:uncharacterized repeat protein (TIGR03847 family)
MASIEYDLNPVSRITTGAIGPAGQRVFYLQARHESTLVTLIVEKMQMTSLAAGLDQFLAEIAQQYPDLSEASGDYLEPEMELEQPIDPAFRVGQLGLGYDRDTDRIVLVAHEPSRKTATGASGRRPLWCSRPRCAPWASGEGFAGRGRPICGNW